MRQRLPVNQRGQVLIVMVVIMLILLVIGFFLFDLQNVIRTRSTAQNGADAAALTAAAWQGRSINMIGELNLLQAATAMLSEVPPYPEAPASPTAEELAASSALITELQTRLTYVGPLLGFAASQQAAKNNGLRAIPSFASSVDLHLNSWLSPINGDIYRNTYGDDPAGLGYAWTEPYAGMLQDIIDRGIAARPVNSRYLYGEPEIGGPASDLLRDPNFYRAVHAHHYCWFYQRGYGPDHPPIDLNGISVDLSPSGWFPGSEYLSLYVDFSTAAPAESALIAGRLQPYLEDRQLSALPEDQRLAANARWAIYEEIGDGWGWGQTGIYDFINPYLHADFRDEFTYAGPGARVITTASPPMISGRWAWDYGSQDEPETRLGRSGSRLRDAEEQLAELSEEESVDSVAAAKPFGQAAGRPPHELGIVLPLFTDVRLIPVALLNENLADADPTFFEFLINVLGHPDWPNIPADLRAQYSYYLEAIDDYNDDTSNFSLRWWDFDEWRNSYMAGEDGIPDTDDDRRDPCEPPRGGPGGGSRGGPGIIH